MNKPSLYLVLHSPIKGLDEMGIIDLSHKGILLPLDSLYWEDGFSCMRFLPEEGSTTVYNMGEFLYSPHNLFVYDGKFWTGWAIISAHDATTFLDEGADLDYVNPLFFDRLKHAAEYCKQLSEPCPVENNFYSNTLSPDPFTT